MTSYDQPDLFAVRGVSAPDAPAEEAKERSPDPAELGDAALVAAIPYASCRDCSALVAEATRRRLTGAVPALEALCRRFKGFGVEFALPEQVAALAGLAAVGGRAAADAVARIIVGQVVQGPAVIHALAAAAAIGARLPGEVVASHLRHDAPEARSHACRLARPSPEVIAPLITLLDDLHRPVAAAAACALGRLGRPESLPALSRLLREDPSREVIEAVSAIADDECLVLLGRVARDKPDLREDVLSALDDMEHPRAATIALAIRRESRRQCGGLTRRL